MTETEFCALTEWEAELELEYIIDNLMWVFDNKHAFVPYLLATCMFLCLFMYTVWSYAEPWLRERWTECSQFQLPLNLWQWWRVHSAAILYLEPATLTLLYLENTDIGITR